MIFIIFFKHLWSIVLSSTNADFKCNFCLDNFYLFQNLKDLGFCNLFQLLETCCWSSWKFILHWVPFHRICAL